jgi:hypothetical protein
LVDFLDAADFLDSAATEALPPDFLPFAFEVALLFPPLPVALDSTIELSSLSSSSFYNAYLLGADFAPNFFLLLVSLLLMDLSVIKSIYSSSKVTTF